MKTLNKMIPTDLRRGIKRNKTTLAEITMKVLKEKNNLMAREIIEKIYTNVVSENYPEIIKNRMITDLSKDFNSKLADRLKVYGVEREKVGKTFVYKLTK